MRALIWILGAVASAAGGAYLMDRRAKRRLSGRFLEALRRGPLHVEAYDPAIVASGLRAKAFRGIVQDTPFEFVGQTDVSGTRWSFLLVWDGSRLEFRWNPVSDGAEHPLKQAYDLLRRRASRDDGISN